VFEVRTRRGPRRRSNRGRWPHGRARSRPSSISNLLQAVDDEHGASGLEAIYALGVIARPPLAEEHVPALVAALDHYDPAIRAGAARVAGRLQVSDAGEALIKAVNDSNADVRYAAMRALGEMREPRAVQALTEQLTYYERGEGAWSALDALALDRASVERSALQGAPVGSRSVPQPPAIEGLGRTGDTSETTALQMASGNDDSKRSVPRPPSRCSSRGATTFPGSSNRCASSALAPQVTGYLLELGPAIEHAAAAAPAGPGRRHPRAGRARARRDRRGDLAGTALQPLLQDRDRRVAQEATWALERLDMRAAVTPLDRTSTTGPPSTSRRT
jgi:hypothetical protein